MANKTIKNMTNTDFVIFVMEFGGGPLVQVFIVDAIQKMAAKVAAADPAACETDFVSGAAWVQAAKRVQELFAEKYGPMLPDDDKPENG